MVLPQQTSIATISQFFTVSPFAIRHPPFAEPPAEDPLDLAAAVELGEPGVDREAEIGVAARQHDAVRLVGQLVGHQEQRLRIRGLACHPEQQHLVARERVHLPGFQRGERLVAALEGHHGRAQQAALQLRVHRGLVGGAGDHADAPVLQLGKSARAQGRFDQHPGGLDVDVVGEIHLLQAREGDGARAAFHVGLALGDRVEAALTGDGMPFHLQPLDLELLLDRSHHPLAHIDREAADLLLLVGERERRRVRAVGDGDGPGGGDVLEPAGGALRMRGARGEQQGKRERGCAFHEVSRESSRQYKTDNTSDW
jgi:hypothetical protein